MASLYAQYLMEKTDDQIIETDSGFATYRYMGNETIYIVDIFIQKGFRGYTHATNLANIIVEEAKTRGCKKLVGTVIPSNKNSTDSLKVLIAYGMKLESSGPDLIVFSKEI